MNGMADVRAPEATLAIPRFEDGFVNMRELLRQLAESVVNEMMSAEADRLCEATGNGRDGYRERGLVTRVGTLTPGIPRLRTGGFFPDDGIGRCQRLDGAAGETCATGTSTRRVQGGGRRDGHGAAVEGPGERHVRAPGLGGGGAGCEAPRPLAHAVPVGRRHLRQV